MRNLQLFIVVSILSSFIFLSSCNTKEKKDALSPNELDSVKVALVEIQDSLDNIWNRMIEDDNQKIADAKRLLEEVSYTNVYNPRQYDSLQQKLVMLKEMRYDYVSMANSTVIDDYDSSSNKVINDIIALASGHPDYQRYPLMKELIADIQEANGRVLKHRINYDYAAKYYNQFLEENKERLEEADTLQNLKKKPLFELAS